jgi:predicted phage terminase large subunit-like protein
MIKRDWWDRWKELPKAEIRIWSFDTAIAEGEENDWTVGGLIREHADGWCIEKVVRKQIEAASLETFIEDLYAADPTDVVLIEDKSSGQRVVQYFRKRKKIPALAFKPGQYGDKTQRLSRISPKIESKKVALPDTSVLQAPWVADFLEEIESFPRGTHDDQVDMLSQGLLYLVFEKTMVGSFPSEPTVPAKPIMPGMKSGMLW